MRDRLPKKPRKYECSVVNLDSESGVGTHWVAYCKDGAHTYYFDSFGNLQPPREFIEYIGDDSTIYYNYTKYQNFGTTNCGHLCIEFMYNFYKNKKEND